MNADVVSLPGAGAHPLALEARTTDVANARELVRLAAGTIRYVQAWRRWLVWDGRRWAPDELGRVPYLAREVVAGLFDAAAEAPRDDQRQLARFAIASGSRRGIEGMIALAATEESVPITADSLDVDPWMLNVANGTIDLRTGELRPHRRSDFLTKIVPARFDPAAVRPRWDRFLAEVLPDTETRNFLQRAVGYSLSGSTAEQCLFILHGVGANGKSVLLETLLDLAGDYGLRTPSSTLLAQRGDSIPNDVAALRGARLVVASESEDGRRLAEARVKELVAGDTVSARFMKAEWFSFRPVSKLFLATNHRPQIRGTDHAIWRRLRLIPFGQTFGAAGGPPADPDLRDRLRTELDGILSWAVAGAVAWNQSGLQAPAVVKDATAAYRTAEDVLAAFIDEATEADPTGSATAGELFATYATWCEAAGERPMSKRGFGLALQDRGYQQVRTRDARRWHGLRIKGRDAW